MSGREDTPAISIVIRCRDEAASLGPVLSAVLAQEAAASFEVIALDSGSRDRTLEVLRRFPVRVEHVAAAEFTYGRALNVGAALARGGTLVYLSAHCRPLSRHWLATLVAPLADPAVVASFGRQVPIPGVNPIEAATTERNFPPAPPARVRFSTANCAVRREAALARPFDEEIAIAEDHLWACGLGPDERIVYVPAAAVEHSHPMTLAHWRGRFYAHGLAAEYARRRCGVELPWFAAPQANGRSLGASRTAVLGRLVARLLREGDLRGLAALPAYAIARTVWYARGVREGRRRYGAPRGAGGGHD